MGHTSEAICDLCGSTAYKCVYDLDDYRMLRCRDCGLVYRHPMPTDQQLYEMYNVPLPISEESLTQYYRDFRQRTYRRMFQTLQSIHENGPPLEVLDVGAGRGWSYDVIREFGHAPLGLDMGSRDCQIASRSGPTIQGTSENLPISNTSVHVILMSDVLEHVRSPRRVLDEAHRVLKPQGCLIIRIPDVSSILIRAMDIAYRLSGCRFKRGGRLLYQVHLFGFTKSSLERYLTETNFRIMAHYRESSKNPAELGRKTWARNPLVRLGVTMLTWLGEITNRQDESVVIAQRE